MKVLVADKISPKGVELLREQPGLEVIEAYGSSPEKILELVKDVHAIAVRSETQITAEVFAAAPLLKAVGRAGVGVDNIDVDAATERGVVVMNTPTGNTIATAELTFTHLLCSARPVPQAAASMRSGKWDRKSFSGIELYRKTLGVLGFGRIGTEVARRAQAFGMRVLAFDPYLSPSRAKALQVELVDAETIYREADFITVHMPLTEQTRHMLNARAFGMMKKTVRILNCARGEIIHIDDLVVALKEGKIGGAGLDVFEVEPLPADHPIRQLPNVSLTPHLGASTTEAQESVGIEVAEALVAVLNGGVIRNAVNMPSLDAATLKAIAPYLDLGTKLGTLAQQLATGRVEKLSVTYWGKLVDMDVNSVTRAVQRGFLRRISGEEVNYVNAPVVLQRLGVQVEIVKSNDEADYTELIQVRAITSEGATASASGTIVGKALLPRIVEINGYDLEAAPSGVLFIYENSDQPGIIGHVGTTFGRDKSNIAAMSLSRNKAGGTALTVLNLDNEPSANALKEVQAHPAIKRTIVVRL